MCQTVSQSDSKWPRKTRKHTHTHTNKHFRIYISRDYIQQRVKYSHIKKNTLSVQNEATKKQTANMDDISSDLDLLKLKLTEQVKMNI